MGKIKHFFHDEIMQKRYEEIMTKTKKKTVTRNIKKKVPKPRKGFTVSQRVERLEQGCIIGAIIALIVLTAAFAGLGANAVATTQLEGKLQDHATTMARTVTHLEDYRQECDFQSDLLKMQLFLQVDSKGKAYCVDIRGAVQAVPKTEIQNFEGL